MLAQQLSWTSHVSADSFAKEMHSLATCLQRFGLPSDSLEVSLRATPDPSDSLDVSLRATPGPFDSLEVVLPTTPRLYLGSSGLQAIRPLPKPPELDTSQVHMRSTPDWMRTASPSSRGMHLPPRAWAQAPSILPLGSRSSSSRSHRRQRAPVTSFEDAEEQNSKKNGLRQLLERQNSWRRQQESLKQRKKPRSLPRPQLSSDARREIMRNGSPARDSIALKQSSGSLKPRMTGLAKAPARVEAAEEVADKKDVHIWRGSFRKDMTEFETAVMVAKSYNFPVREVKSRLDQYRKLKKGRDAITVGQFCNEIKEEYMLGHETLVESSLRAGNLDEHQTLDFETFLLWSMKTDFLEEMLVTDPQERHFRQVIREHCLHPGDIDNIRSAYDGFDANGNGTIDYVEFKALLCKLRKVDAEGDIPEPEFKRAWRTACPVELDGHINFEQFLVWILKSGELARYRESRNYDDMYF
eukprot:TRINITY_DN63916_c0_g1_i1.p1 TRINITY_DN63916_c0_g1~~TRINITY_DN63916_c0_g1_i1.p1  ORF type:complete len:469 (+),score=76.24 TRINITY_DN63916_c0_g1_i1:34-1440(+)